MTQDENEFITLLRLHPELKEKLEDMLPKDE